MNTYVGITLSLLIHVAFAGVLSISLPQRAADFGSDSGPIVVRLQKSLPSESVRPKKNNDQVIAPKKAISKLPKGFDNLIKSFVSPEYPVFAIRKEIEGKVVLTLEVAKDGSVTLVTINNSSGHQLLDDSALKAASLWKFKSSESNSTFSKEIIFKLK